MKISVALLLLVAVAAAAPPKKGGHGGHGKPEPHRGPEPLPCEIEINGTTTTKACFPSDVFECAPLDQPKTHRNITVLSVCKPKNCTQDSQCGAGGLCTNGTVKPTKADRTLLDTCHDRSSERSSEDEDSESGEGKGAGKGAGKRAADKPTTCAVSVAARLASRACNATYENGTVASSHPCPARNGKGDCNAEVACQVRLGGELVNLHFCEHDDEDD